MSDGITMTDLKTALYKQKIEDMREDVLRAMGLSEVEMAEERRKARLGYGPRIFRTVQLVDALQNAKPPEKPDD